VLGEAVNICDIALVVVIFGDFRIPTANAKVRTSFNAALKLEASAMPNRPTSNPVQFIQGAPALHVPDVKATAKYYRDVLGFQWDYGDDDYAVVWRDNSAIHFVRGDRSPSGVHLFQWVRDVDAYHREIVDRGAEVIEEPADRPYDIRDFTIRDPNGVSIVFGQDL
jgi:predicted enzyme related to lactoylglutathione lyase